MCTMPSTRGMSFLRSMIMCRQSGTYMDDGYVGLVVVLVLWYVEDCYLLAIESFGTFTLRARINDS